MIRLYRAKVKYNGNHYFYGQWVKGFYYQKNWADGYIIDTEEDEFGNAPFEDVEIDLSTLGQSTGLFDKNGVEIYEGDIVKGAFYGIPVPVDNYVFKIQWSEANAGFQASAFDSELCEVIGNIYDNPELSEVE